MNMTIKSIDWKKGLDEVLTKARLRHRKYHPVDDISKRPYQRIATNKIVSKIRNSNIAFGEMATGTGKTLVAKWTLTRLLTKDKEAKALCISHSNSLNQQFEKVFDAKIDKEFFPVPVGQCDGHSRINYITIQKLCSLKRFNRAYYNELRKQYKFKWVDETHRYPSKDIDEKEWASVLHDLQQSDDNKIIGVSATLGRMDGKPLLIDGFDNHVVFEYPIQKAVKEKYLSEVYGLCIFSNVEPDSESWDNDDLDLKFSDAKFEERARIINDVLLRANKKRDKICQSLIFVKRVAEAEKLEKYLSSKLGRIEVISGKTPKKHREEIFDLFRDRKVNVIINVKLVLEGIDLPCCDVVLMARPTRSIPLYMQMLGRGVRLSKKKDFLLVIDLVDNISNNHLKEIIVARKLVDKHSGVSSGPVFTQNSDDDANGIITHITEHDMKLYVKCTATKKEQLLEMARNGEPRPSCKNHPLGRSLINYTNKKSSSYDPEFDKKIRELKPDWFENTADTKKEQLLEMAKNGEPRPSRKNPLGSAIINYTNKKNRCYDHEFDKKIRKLRPDWFETADTKKEQLLEMARNGEPRPSSKNHPLGMFLVSYTNKKSCYDHEFDKKIRKSRPDWFENTSDTKKEQLLEMAKNGEPRPSWKNHPLGISLSHYTRKTRKTWDCYDPEFDKKIRELKPDWFENTSDTKKEQLLEMARNGEPKPTGRNHPLGISLINYTYKKNRYCYDPEFDKKIKELKPDWFISQREKAQEKKEQLLEMAINGEPRPSCKNHPLGRSLINYTCKKNRSYDHEFDKKIRKSRPDWFENTAATKKEQLLEMAKKGYNV